MEEQRSQIELQSLDTTHNDRGDLIEDEPTVRLPPVDGGKAAWLFLAGSFSIELLIWGMIYSSFMTSTALTLPGFPYSFGILQNYYSTHDPFQNANGIAAIGTTCSGIMYLAAPLEFAAFSRWPRFCRHAPFYGLPLVCLALFLSSLSTSVTHLLLTQGVLYALGGALLYYPILMYIDEWFVRRKGLAYGVMWAGTGCGGLVGPLVLEWGLARYGVVTFIRGWAVAILCLIAPFLYFVRPRMPERVSARLHRPGFRVGYGFVRTRTFWALEVGNVVQGLGYFVPTLYLPMYAASIGLSTEAASLMISILNVASVPGIVVLSMLADRMSVTNVVFISAFGSALSVFFLWGFSTSIPVLVLFVIFYGFFAGGYTATYAGIAQEMRRISAGSDLGSIFGMISAGRGIGNVVCGPLSESILKGGTLGGKAILGYGTEYGSLIIFTGITASLALVPWVTKRLHII